MACYAMYLLRLRKLLSIGHFRVLMCLCFKASLSAKPFLRPIYTIRLCRIRQAYDRPTTWIVSCKSNLQLAYGCRVGPKSCGRPVASLLYATKSYRVNRPLGKWLWFAWKWNCMHNSFHMKRFAPRLVLKQRHKRTCTCLSGIRIFEREMFRVRP